jgi:hypothetical protein
MDVIDAGENVMLSTPAAKNDGAATFNAHHRPIPKAHCVVDADVEL